MKNFILIICIFSVVNAVHAETFSDNFDSHTTISDANAAGWDIDTSYVTLETNGCNSGKCLRINIPGNGTNWYVTRNLNESAPYIRFYAKRTNFNGTGGNKFLKLFGDGYPSTYANITYSQEYTNGQFYIAETGDGSSTQGDASCAWYWGPHSLSCPGTAVKQGGTLDMVENRWYCFEFYVSPNTDNNSNGIIQIWVDGVLRVHYSGIKIRNNANNRNFSFMSLVNYAQNVTSPYQIWVDDIVVSRSYIGPVGTSGSPVPYITPPSSPKNLKIQ
jgi:hypothetical protein